ncbi:MAG: HprK-related kinase A [Rhodocyclaceae bacterium]
MKIGTLSETELSRHLHGDGLRLRTGPFVVSLRSPIADLAARLAVLYSEFPVAEPDGFADFHVSVRLASGPRRLIKPQAIFDFDGFHPFNPLPGDQAFAMLEWGLNWCVYTHAHEFLIIHGASLERDGKAVLLPAPSGSGKSTLCAALTQRGWRLMSDELILIERESGTVRALARPISLKNASIAVMRRYAPDAVITEPVHDTAKGSVAHMRATQDSIVRMDEPATPHWVIVPRYRADADTHVEPMSKAALFMTLVDNAFNYSLLREQGFSCMAGLTDACSGYRIEYGSLDEAIAALDRLVEHGT